MELEHYMNARHSNCGLESLAHVDSKLRAWKKSYATISLLKSRSGLGFQYSDGSLLVDDPKAWDDLIKMMLEAQEKIKAAQEEPNVSSWSNTKSILAQVKPNESTRSDKVHSQLKR
ncbi:hypothetical protein H5410_045807 [Solanum commersonii]|uniref:Uncharacterized protein n=1 Tax=Solanum commersonii TaxID=4109 RepID=A0A9J5XCM4_SOLCO|nr:hypothetical protein H5410_045807 [Solanum commersonii]